MTPTTTERAMWPAWLRTISRPRLEDERRVLLRAIRLNVGKGRHRLADRHREKLAVLETEIGARRAAAELAAHRILELGCHECLALEHLRRAAWRGIRRAGAAAALAAVALLLASGCTRLTAAEAPVARDIATQLADLPGRCPCCEEEVRHVRDRYRLLLRSLETETVAEAVLDELIRGAPELAADAIEGELADGP